VFSTPGRPFSLSLSPHSVLLAASASTCPKAHQNVSSFPWANASTRRESALPDRKLMGNDDIIDFLTHKTDNTLSAKCDYFTYARAIAVAASARRV